MTKLVAAAVAGLVMLSSAAYAGGAEGTWVSENGGLKVRLSDCGGVLCGKVVWLNEPIDRVTGKPKTDKLNPDPAKRSLPLIGLKVAKNFKPIGRNEWAGTIYNADDVHSSCLSQGRRRAHRAPARLRVRYFLPRPHLDADQLADQLNARRTVGSPERHTQCHARTRPDCGPKHQLIQPCQ